MTTLFIEPSSHESSPVDLLPSRLCPKAIWPLRAAKQEQLQLHPTYWVASGKPCPSSGMRLRGWAWRSLTCAPHIMEVLEKAEEVGGGDAP